MNHYTYLSEGISGKKTVKPVTVHSLQSSKVNKKKGFLSWLCGSSQESVKPVVYNKETYAEEYYRKFGIIHNGSDLKSCIQSVL